MSVRHLETLFSPRSVALVGATPRPGALGRIVLERLREGGFKGPIWPVNPKHTTILGQDAYRDPAALPETPDLGVVTVPPPRVPAAIDALGRAGCRGAVVITDGLGPDTEHGRAMKAAARRHGLRLIGPDCLGLIRPRLGLNASFAHAMPAPGRIAFLSQSGALIGAVIDWAARHGIGFSHIVSMGDQADCGVADLLDFLATDTESRAILLYLEGIRRPPVFMSAARAAARVKPVIAIKSGRHAEGTRRASSHTGAMAGTDALFDAAFERAGILRIRYLEELFDAAEVLDHLPPLAGPDRDRLAIVTNGGGAGALAADALADAPARADGRLAELAPETLATLDAALPAGWSRANPVDIIGDAGPERYAAAMDAVLADPGVDAVLAMNCPSALASGEEAAQAVAEARQRHRKGRMRPKPMIATWLGEAAADAARQRLETAGIAAFSTPGEAVRGFGYLVRRAKLLDRLSRVPPSAPNGQAPDWAAARAAIAAAAARGVRTLNEAEAKTVLAAAGVPTVRTLTATTAAEAVAAAETLAAEGIASFAVKLLSDTVTHKSDVGGVVLDIETPAAVGAAVERMAAHVTETAPDVAITGFSVQQMLRRPAAHELICGISDDPIFGPAILFGAGGLAVEVVDDKALALPPLDLALARDLIGRTRIARLMAGYRRRPAADIDAVAAVLIRLAEIARALPMVTELDINPLLADDRGAVALDARITIARGRLDEPAPNRRMAIRPYPAELEGTVSLADGRRVPCRPVRPEDAPLYTAFFDKIDATDLRLRFFSTMRKVPASMIATLTQIDYARAMAFIALDPEDGAIMAACRLSIDAEGERAEYGVQVRSDLKGLGLGRAMMERLIAHGRAIGLSEIWGDVLSENRGMLALAAKLGFRRDGPAEDGVVPVRLALDRSG